MSREDFWSATPIELKLMLDARLFQAEHMRKQAIQMAWLTAALERSKRLPPLKRLLGEEQSRPLHGDELIKRQAEHAAIVAHMAVGDRRRGHGR